MTDELTSNEDVIRAGYDDRAELYAIDAAAALSTDERLCAVCGHGRYEDPRHGTCNHQIGGSPVFCSCHRFSPEAAPSTDEGEARFDPDAVAAARVRFPDPEPVHGVPVKADVVYALQHAYIEGWETGRAPLEESRQRLTDAFCEVWLREVGRADAAEERIRELEAEVSSWSAQAETSEEEAERLREAMDAIGWHVSPESPIGRIVHAALATPPSSTEGTNTLKANFDGCPFCGGDDSVGIHRIGRCEGTKEVEG